MVDINQMNFNALIDTGNRILIHNESEGFKVISLHKPDGDSVMDDNTVFVNIDPVSIDLSKMGALSNMFANMFATPKQPLSPAAVPAAVSTEVPAGGKSRRKKRVNRKKHTKKKRQ
jgi:hypothetical protein